MRFQILQLDETHETANVKILMHLGIYAPPRSEIRALSITKIFRYAISKEMLAHEDTQTFRMPELQ